MVTSIIKADMQHAPILLLRMVTQRKNGVPLCLAILRKHG
jgi:hypothetical protein